jgi:predicted nucleic acid-binding protein
VILVDTSVWVEHAYVDAHLLASALLTRAQLWTRDRALKVAAAALDVAFEE